MNVLFLALSFSTPFHKSFYEDLLRVFQKTEIIYMLLVQKEMDQRR